MSFERISKMRSSCNLVDFPALEKSQRFILQKTLEESLFGTVKIAIDKENHDRLVCIKISVHENMRQGLAFSGPHVMENIQKEVSILTFLTNQARAIKRQQSFAQFVMELRDETFHYLITEYGGKDLFSFLQNKEIQTGEAKMDENMARYYFRQLVTAVAFLHKHHIIHTDLSVENICIDEAAQKLNLIDFGLATIRPNSRWMKVLKKQTKIKKPILCSGLPLVKHWKNSKKYASSRFLFSAFHSQQIQEMRVRLGLQKYIVARPGKLGYMSPELFNFQEWDGYSNDCYALGTCLYIMLTARPPYQKPNETDCWFRMIYSGKWLQTEYRTHINATTAYGFLSEEALDLIDKIIKPQEQRLNLQQIMDHPWMKTQNAT